MKNISILILISLNFLTVEIFAGDFEDAKKSYKDEDYKAAFHLLSPFAKDGNNYAQHGLGFMYHTGQGVSKDYKMAMYWYLKAAEQDFIHSHRNIGVMYADGQGVPKNIQKAIHWYQMAAELGDSKSQLVLGAMYNNGDGVKKDHKKAFYWIKKSAEQGDADSQFYLGLLYQHGKGVSKNNSIAIYWIQKAAEQGHGKAQSNLAHAYKTGNGIEKDNEKAIFWAKKAAEQGNGDNYKYNLLHQLGFLLILLIIVKLVTNLFNLKKPHKSPNNENNLIKHAWIFGIYFFVMNLLLLSMIFLFHINNGNILVPILIVFSGMSASATTAHFIRSNKRVFFKIEQYNLTILSAIFALIVIHLFGVFFSMNETGIDNINSLMNIFLNRPIVFMNYEEIPLIMVFILAVLFHIYYKRSEKIYEDLLSRGRI